jgi:uncharacterized protein (TIGR00369 family)
MERVFLEQWGVTMDQQVNVNKESSLLAIMRRVLEESPFNRLLGLRVDHISMRHGRMSFFLKPELIGNVRDGFLHGGVIATAFDATGFLTACASTLLSAKDLTTSEVNDRIARIRTIDLRVDYLSPGKGRRFSCVGTVMRNGRSVSVTRMELRDRKGTLIAIGTGAYLLG